MAQCVGLIRRVFAVGVARGITKRMLIRTVWARGLLWVLLAAATVPATVLIGAAGGDLQAQAQTIRDIRVEGNRRVEPETVRSYLLISPGDPYDPVKVDSSLKALFATGLFANVSIRRQSSTLIVLVVENPIINRVAFEGNSQIDDDTLRSEIQLKPRSVFTRARVQADVQRIIEVYRRSGRFAARVDPKIIHLENSRVDLVFELQEGPKTTVRTINFVGNAAFTDSQLRDVITTSRTTWLSFLKPTNIYDPDRLNLDRELLRQFYLKNGYADVRIISAVADLDPAGRGFFITFTIDEGEQYRFGAIDIETSLPNLNPENLRGKIETKTGKIYDASKIDKTVENVTIEVAGEGYAFARVVPRADRDPFARTISLTYIIEEGPRVYIERIDIVGNVRTLDYVIRREFAIAEGDAYNRLLVDAAKRRLRNLGFFKSVDIKTEPGTAPDRVIVVVHVIEQPTGELSFGAGYSTSEGVIGDISLTERNLMGRGQFIRLKLSGSLERFQIDLSFTQPHFLDRNMSAGFDIFHKEADFSDQASFKSRSTGGALRLGIPLANDWAVQTRYTFVHQDIFEVKDNASQAVKDNAGVTIVSSVGYTVFYDTRNVPKNPTQGLYFSLAQDLAGVGGDVNYIRTIADARGYYPIRRRLTLVGRLQGGVIEGYGGDDVRLTDVFFKGANLVRGFDTAGIGPRDGTTGDALGGKIFAGGTVEVRFPLPLVPDSFGMSGAVFADAGTLFDVGDIGTLDPNDVVADDGSIRSSVGFSLIWESPLGPLRADIAQAIVKDRNDETQVFRFGASTQF